MVEYRLEELARISGVSARNIRAYRERGLLDPPRRQGRSAYYNRFHLAQLKTIDQLLGRGYSSAHIAEFITSVRQGRNLADTLGLRRPFLAARAEPGPGSWAAPSAREAVALDIAPDGDEARRLLEHGLAEAVPDGVALIDPALAAIVRRSPTTQLDYVRVLLRMIEVTRDGVDELATAIADELVPTPASRAEDPTDALERVHDHRELAAGLVVWRLDRAVERRVAAYVSDLRAATED